MARSPGFERYARDGALVLGGGAAILLQVADPVVARGVAQHSAFADDPMRRLRHTLGYVYAVTLGDDTQVRRAAGSSTARTPASPARPTPTGSSGWRRRCTASGVDVHELLRGPMPPALADEVYAASAGLGTALQCRRSSGRPIAPPSSGTGWMRWPPSRSATMRARWPAICCTRQRVPLWVRAGMPLGRTLTAGLLPASIRDAYGLPWRPRAFRARGAGRPARARLTPAPPARAALPPPPRLRRVRFAALRARWYKGYLAGGSLLMAGDNAEHAITYFVMWQTFHSPLLAGSR